MKKAAVAIVIIIAVVGAWAIIGRVWAPSGPPPVVAGETTLDACVPEGALTLAAQASTREMWDYFQTQDWYGRLVDLHIWQRIAETDVWRGLIDGLGELERKSGCSVNAETVMELLGEDWALAFYGVEAGEAPRILFAARVAGRPQLLDAWETLLQSEGTPPGTAMVDGREISVADIDGGTFGWVLDGDLLLFSTDAGLVSAAMAARAGDGALGDSADYRKVHDMLPDGMAGVAYADGVRLSEELRELYVSLEPDLAGFQTSLTLQGMAAMGSVWGLYEDGMRGQGVSFVPPDMPWAATRKAHLRGLELLPAGTVHAQAQALDIPGMYEGLIDVEERGPVGEALAEFENETGIDIAADIMTWIGKEYGIGFIGMNLDGMFPLPQYVVYVAVEDEVAALAFLDKLESVIKLKLGAEGDDESAGSGGSGSGGGGGLRFTRGEYDGHTVISVSYPLVPLRPTVIFVEGYMFITVSEGLARSIAEVSAGEEGSVTTDEMFRRVIPGGTRDCCLIQYYNVAEGLDMLDRLVDYAVSFGEGFAADDADVQELLGWAPDVKELLKALKFIRASGARGAPGSDGATDMQSITLLED